MRRQALPARLSAMWAFQPASGSSAGLPANAAEIPDGRGATAGALKLPGAGFVFDGLHQSQWQHAGQPVLKTGHGTTCREMGLVGSLANGHEVIVVQQSDDEGGAGFGIAAGCFRD